MRQLRQAVVNFIRKEDGPTAVEYAVMLSLIIVVCLVLFLPQGLRGGGWARWRWRIGKVMP